MSKKKQIYCKQCNKKISVHKRILRAYKLCLNCLPDELRCRATTRSGKRCRLPLVADERCQTHLIYSKERPKFSKVGFVYIFDLGFDNLYKIGRSRNWVERLRDLQAANPKLRKVLAVHVKNMKWVENECHAMFKENHERGEIFKLSQEDISNLTDFLRKEYIGRKLSTDISPEEKRQENESK